MTEAKDPTHWLHRLDVDEWLAASRLELAQCLEALRGRRHRQAIAGGRRSAGMALNAVLRLAPNDAWGRSYIEHLHAVAADASLPEILRDSARELLETPLEGPRLVPLGRPDEGPAVAAATVVDWCEMRVAELRGG